MKIYISICRGQTGNELFQFINLLRYAQRKNCYVITINFNKSKKIFNINNKIKNISISNEKFLYKIINKLIIFLTKKKIISQITQLKTKDKYKIETKNLVFSKGIFKNIIFVSGFYQSYKFLKKINKIDININLKKFILEYKNKNFKSDYLNYFIHIRKGDYSKFIIDNKNIILPNSYYESAIQIVKKENFKVFFHIFSDEPVNTNELKLNINEFVVVDENNPVHIFCLMQSFDGGIIANSSLSYISAYYAKKNTPFKNFIAPYNNLGYNINKEIPSGINNKIFFYVNN